MSAIDTTAPPTPSHSTASYQLASPTSTTSLAPLHNDQFDATKANKALNGPTYPPLTYHPQTWLRYLIFYIQDRDVPLSAHIPALYRFQTTTASRSLPVCAIHSVCLQ